jgi:uncharacterized membrane protein YebE (DUF533 family)
MDAERILGALVRDALIGGAMGRRHRGRLRRGGGSFLPPAMRGMLGMGALGVAIAAFEHYTRQQKTPGGGQSFTGVPPPPPPPPSAGSGGGDGLSPRTRPASGAPPPPPPPPPPPAGQPAEQEALLMIQAMIAAANADYELDAAERERIVHTMEESGLDQAERQLVLDQLERPVDIATLAAKATTPTLRRDVYLASAMAIEADTKAEQNYLARLARELGLSDAEVEELRKVLTEADDTAR